MKEIVLKQMTWPPRSKPYRAGFGRAGLKSKSKAANLCPDLVETPSGLWDEVATSGSWLKGCQETESLSWRQNGTMLKSLKFEKVFWC